MPKEFGCFRGLFARMAKDEGLVVTGLIEDFFVADLIHYMVSFGLLRNSYELLLETARPV
jgi:hypothetical protein